MDNQLAFSDLDYSTAINILEQRGLFSAQEEMSHIELENFFDQNFYVFEKDKGKYDAMKIAVELLNADHIKQLFLYDLSLSLSEKLIAQGFLSDLGRFYVVSVEYPFENQLIA